MTTTGIRVILAWAVIGICPGTFAADDDATRKKVQKSLEASAKIEKTIMVPTRDGTRLATDLYRPLEAEGPLPTIFWRTPYNFHELGSSRLEFISAAIEQGYAFVIQNERGRFFSEGDWEILGRPRTDGYDALTWIAEQPWANGRVGTIGCSSSAEWQLALAAMDHPAHAAMVPMASGAGIGRVGPFHEQGNWYRGGAFQMLFATWLYWVQHTERPAFSEELSDEELARVARFFDLAPEMPEVEWQKALKHLPLEELIEHVEGPKGIYSEFIRRAPDDPAWYRGGLYHDDEPFAVPSLWLNSWYDVSIGPNMELFQHATGQKDQREAAQNQFVVIAPTAHCRFSEATAETIVGERNMGDARLDYDAMIFSWFDFWLKGDRNKFSKKTPKVQYYTMGSNEWQSSPVWPPEDVEPVTYYLDSGGNANSLFGDGRLATAPPGHESGADSFPYDPETPVPSLGGGVCCIGGVIEAGAFDQRNVEARHDVLVYTSEPLAEGIEVTGSVEVTLFVSSDAKDTDFTVKLVDVDPDGAAYNLDETIQRARYREGYDRQVFMQAGEVYELVVSPMTTSNYFAKGHRIRIEVSSSNFPRFARNLNTGGDNHVEAEGRVARNTVHHSSGYPSRIVLPVVKR